MIIVAADILFLKTQIRAINKGPEVQWPGGRRIRFRGRAGRPRRRGGKEKKANSGSFDGKPLISLKTAKEKAWKYLEKAWNKLGILWKRLGKIWISLEKLARVKRRRAGRFRFVG